MKAPTRGSEPAATIPRRILLVFVDGVGVGAGDPAINPLAAAELPGLRELAGGARPVAEDLAGGPVVSGRGGLAAVDATLGTEGLPQSGTGQTALLTGDNAARRMGRHFGPWVPTALREFLAAHSLFRTGLDAGMRVAFANAHPLAHHGPQRRPGAFPFAAAAAGLLVRDETSLRRGEALVSSITTDRWRRHVAADAPTAPPGDWGRRLAAIAAAHHLTVFGHYDTDYVGHRGSLQQAVAAVQLLDAFLAGVAGALDEDMLLLVVSDHGNIEDVRGGHTRNPALLVTAGAGHAEAARHIRSITDVAPWILSRLELGSGEPRAGSAPGGGAPT